MSILARSLSLMAVIMCVGGSMTHAGLYSHSTTCGDSCADDCAKTCCPSDYCCKCESEEEKVKRHCFETKCKPVVIPGIKLPCCKCKLKKLFGGRCGSNSGCCGSSGCGDSGCGDSGCGSCGNGCCGSGGGMLSKLCSKLTQCKVRCVNTYEKKEYECGTKCVYKWSAEAKCGSGSGCCDTGSFCAPSGCGQ